VRQHQQEQTYSAERERWIKEEILADRYSDPKDIESIFQERPELRGYKPDPEHVRAVDVRHVRRALFENSRANSSPEEREMHRRRLKELEEIWPGIVEDLQAH
jgi:hypothetical protein